MADIMMRRTVALILALAAAPAYADADEDKCILEAAKLVPAVAQVTDVKSAPAPTELIKAAGRDPHLRWMFMTFTMGLGKRALEQSFICARTQAGNWVAIIVDHP